MSKQFSKVCRGFVQVPTVLLLRKHVSKQQNELAGESGCCSSVAEITDKAASIYSQVADNPEKAAKEQQHGSPDVLQPAKQSMQKPKTRVTCQLLCFFFMFILGLLLLSEMQLRHHLEHFTTSTLGSLGRPQATKQQSLPLGASKCQHWTQHVYGYMLTVRCAVAPPKALSSTFRGVFDACRAQIPHPTLACGGTSLQRCFLAGEHH